jgi:hypothetical protein
MMTHPIQYICRLICALIFLGTPLHAADNKDHAYVRAALSKIYDRQGITAAITSQLIKPADVKRIIATRIDTRLTASALGYHGEVV